MSIRFATLACCILIACGPRPVELGFWFEPVTFASPRIGGPISASELATIETIARSEIAKAFAPFGVPLTANRNARYSVRVVQRLTDARMFREADVAGQSRAVSFGGSGAVSFDFVANGAMVYSPEDASRAIVIEALGRALGRVAVHEFAHQLAPQTQIHDTQDPNAYEHGSVSAAQYFGEMYWDIAGPALEQRLKRR